MILAGSVAAIIVAANELNSGNILRPEIVLPLIVIVGVVALLATLAITAATFGLFNISDKQQALGLPAGSVQAVIALSLILIFAVVALYASSTAGIQKVESTGLTRTELEAIPPEQVVSSQPEGGGQGTYAVVRGVNDPDKNDINTQLLTTVSTLVVAVAGFYFGSKSVQEGNKAVKEGIEAATAVTRSLILIEPISPHTWEETEESLLIKVQSVPADARLRSAVQNDDEIQLGEVSSGTFVYRPGGNVRKPGTVTLQFAQVDEPSVSATLIVNFPGGEGGAVQPEVEPPGPEAKPPEPEDLGRQLADCHEKIEALQHQLTVCKQTILKHNAPKITVRPDPSVKDPSASPESPS